MGLGGWGNKKSDKEHESDKQRKSDKERERPWEQKPGKEGIGQLKDHYEKGFKRTRDVIGIGVSGKKLYDAIKGDKAENERLTKENQELKDKIRQQEDKEMRDICRQCARPVFEHRGSGN